MTTKPFECQECGRGFSKPVGRCPGCGGVDIDVSRTFPAHERAARMIGTMFTSAASMPSAAEIEKVRADLEAEQASIPGTPIPAWPWA